MKTSNKKHVLIFSSLLIAFIIPTSTIAKNMSQEYWSFTSEVDGFTDEEKNFAIVLAEGGMRYGFIAAGCYPGKKFELKISAGKYIGDKEIANNVRYRVDKESPQKVSFKPASEKFVYSNNLNSRFIKDLIKGEDRVLIETTSYNYKKSKASFTLNGAKNALEKVISSCK